MKRDHPEHRLSHYFAQLVERIVLEPKYATAIDHSGRAIGGSSQAQINWRNHQKWMGIQPSILDWHLFQVATGAYAWIELKYGDNKPDGGQLTTMQLLRERGVFTGCAYTIPQAYDLLVEAGFRLHGNAENIMREVAERHDAAQMAALSPAKKRSRVKQSQSRFTWGKAAVRRAAARGIRT